MNIYEKYPDLTDGTVIIRKMSDSDADALAQFTSNAEVYRTLPTFLYELKYEDKHKVIALADEELFDTGEGILMGIYLTEDPGHLVGIAEIYNYEKNKAKASIGYRLDSPVWGRGIATRAVALLKEYLIGDAGLRTITAHVLKDNAGSKKTLLKNGFVCKYPDLLEDWGFGELMLTDKFSFKRDWMEGGADKLSDTEVEQFVMAYEAEQDRIRAILPEGYTSLRPVLRINSEIRNESVLYLEFNTPVEADGRRGWLNIANWKSTNDGISYERSGGTVRITAPFLTLTYTGTGVTGGCPAEKDNQGCYYLGGDIEFRPAEVIDQPREFCDCEFRWSFHEGDAGGKSQGRTIPAYCEPAAKKYEKTALSAENAAAIPCRQVLGAYIVRFVRVTG